MQTEKKMVVYNLFSYWIYYSKIIIVCLSPDIDSCQQSLNIIYAVFLEACPENGKKLPCLQTVDSWWQERKCPHVKSASNNSLQPTLAFQNGCQNGDDN